VGRQRTRSQSVMAASITIAPTTPTATPHPTLRRPRARRRSVAVASTTADRARLNAQYALGFCRRSPQSPYGLPTHLTANICRRCFVRMAAVRHDRASRT
jgi:hypothetical protein